jgi:hypothetical protein
VISRPLSPDIGPKAQQGHGDEHHLAGEHAGDRVAHDSIRSATAA